MASDELVPSDPPSESDLRTLNNLRVLSNVLGSRGRFAGEAGLTFSGARDLYLALGYKRILLPRDYRARYLRNGVAARIVEAMPRATWRSGGDLIEDEDPETLTDFEEAWDELNQRLQIWSMFQRADILCGMGRYAIIILGAPGDMSGEMTELKTEDLMYLSPFSEEDAMISKFELDVTSPRFGLPTEYVLRRTHISMATIQPPALLPGRPIHWSRVIHIADNLLDDQTYGQARLERVWNLLDDLEKVTGGGAEAFWKRADAGLQLKLDPMIKADPVELEKVKEQIEEYTDGLRRVLTTRGIDINPLSSSTADFSSPVKAIMDQISASTGIPARILTGSERGELASTQDRANWEERVSDRRSYFAGPQVVRPFVNKMIQFGVLPKPEHYEVRWPDIRNFSEEERADIATKWAMINKAFGGIVVTRDEIRDRILYLSPLKNIVTAEASSIKAITEMSTATKAGGPAPPPSGGPPLPESPGDISNLPLSGEDATLKAASARTNKRRRTLKMRMLGMRQPIYVTPEMLQLLQAVVEEKVIEPITLTAEKPVVVHSPVTVNMPPTVAVKKSVVRTPTGFEITEEVQP